MMEKKIIPPIIFGILFFSLQLLRIPIENYEHTLQQTAEYSLIIYFVGMLIGGSVVAIVMIVERYLKLNMELRAVTKKPGIIKTVHYFLVCVFLAVAVWGAFTSYTFMPSLSAGFTGIVYLQGFMIGIGIMLAAFGFDEIYQYIQRT